MQESVNTEKPAVVLVSSVIESVPVVDGARRFCFFRRNGETLSLCTVNLLAPLLSKIRVDPSAKVASQLALQTLRVPNTFRERDTRHNAATSLSDHQFHIPQNFSWRVGRRIFWNAIFPDALAVDRVLPPPRSSGTPQLFLQRLSALPGPTVGCSVITPVDGFQRPPPLMKLPKIPWS